MCFFLYFLVHSLIRYQRARVKSLKATSKYYLAFGFFYFMTLINYVQNEIQLIIKNSTGSFPFPDLTIFIMIFEETLQIESNSVFTLILFLISITPLIHVNETRFLNWNRPYLTMLAFIHMIASFIALNFSYIPLLYAVLLVIGILMLMAGCASIHVKMYLKSEGKLKKYAFITLLGWFIYIMGVLFPIFIVPELHTILSHLISIIGACFIFYGTNLTEI